MKWLTISLSILTLYYLVNSLVSEDGSIIEDKKLSTISTFSQPNKNTLKLAIEADWLIDHEKIAQEKKLKQAQANKKADVVTQKPVKLYPTLTIAGVDYQLLGIFKSNNLPFILIKANKLAIKKVVQGAEVSPGITLQQVLANKITLFSAGNTIEFKLFEPSPHA